MRAIGPAGWSSHGFFGFEAKTFGNPSGSTSGDGHLVPPGGGPENAIAIQFAAGLGGFMMGGFQGATSSTQFTAIRFNTVFANLATQADTPISNLADGIGNVFFANGNFIVGDSDGTIANDMGDGLAWALAINPAGAAFPSGTGYALTFDVVHDTVILSDNNSTNIYTTPNTTPLTLTANATGAVTKIGAVAYKGTGGLTLAQEQGGGSGAQIWQSTDGGTTWAAVAAAPFAANNGQFIGFGQTQWVAVGGNALTSALATSNSTDDGATWSAPFVLPGGQADGTFLECSAATDGAGNWVIISTSPQTPNYWVSSDDGGTWTAPNLFTAQGGAIAGNLIRSGAQWLAIWWDPTQSFSFLATSVDGRSWTPVGNVREPT